MWIPYRSRFGSAQLPPPCSRALGSCWAGDSSDSTVTGLVLLLSVGMDFGGDPLEFDEGYFQDFQRTPGLFFWQAGWPAQPGLFFWQAGRPALT